ncbi:MULTISPECIES: hypothetical protein [Pseudothermotoga]|uniref:hypothetical protein n=1 Tax=Pseudothermotoga TaxID=1643951 RepID=UPI0002F7C9C5|nr:MULTISPECIES: hypothetical protein [Pseudothermotoga]KUK20577.1 MAG: Uncharacterized protein XD56_1505 [Pseudothermotoga lettingae]MDI3494285.1 hypothetical protein [Pseudothermotoga sp.]MDK2884074.1 hypothetical protein [Pseudothermotoga sp.]GLI47930.1 hypothetical protein PLETTINGATMO_00990 [Pseudothermotoga lettingae TMO]HBJ82049.1 hypothetical protein [Pseudothermotoga sp.]
MEKINLYRHKKQILKLSSFLILLVSLILPVIAVRFTSEFYKQSALASLEAQHHQILSKYNLDLTVSSLEKQVDDIASENRSLFLLGRKLQNTINQIESHLIRYTNGTHPIKEVFNLWSKSSSNWMMLSELKFDGSMKLTIYELYQNGFSPAVDRISQKLIELGYTVSKSVEYDTSMDFLSKRLTKVTVEGRR